jgi:hypothetical protein
MTENEMKESSLTRSSAFIRRVEGNAFLIACPRIHGLSSGALAGERRVVNEL